MYDDNGNGRITCEEARAHGIAPIHRGHSAYEYMNDRDGDGAVCEQKTHRHQRYCPKDITAPARQQSRRVLTLPTTPYTESKNTPEIPKPAQQKLRQKGKDTHMRKEDAEKILTAHD